MEQYYRLWSKQRDEREITTTEQLKHKQQHEHEWKMAFLVIQCMNIKSSKLLTINLPLGLNFWSLLTIIDQILEVDSFLLILNWHLVKQADDFCSNLQMDGRFQHRYQHLQFKLGTQNYYLVRTEDNILKIEFRKRYNNKKKDQTSFTSTNIKLKLRFDVHLTFHWCSLEPYLTTRPSSDLPLTLT